MAADNIQYVRISSGSFDTHFHSQDIKKWLPLASLYQRAWSESVFNVLAGALQLFRHRGSKNSDISRLQIFRQFIWLGSNISSRRRNVSFLVEIGLFGGLNSKFEKSFKNISLRTRLVLLYGKIFLH